MTVSAKNRRKIVVDGRDYLWWVAEDESSFISYGLTLTIVSEDRRVFVKYHLNQAEEARRVTVLGAEFRQVKGCGGPWRRFRCPSFGSDSSVTPGDVASFIRWSLDGAGTPVEVNYLGLALTGQGRA